MQDTSILHLAPLDDGYLEYEVRGDGEALLFIHGALIADAFLPLMAQPDLARYRRIRYRRRGYEGSTGAPLPADTFISRSAGDALALLRHLRVDRAHIVGHSSGAVIALQLACDAPSMIRSLVLLEPPLRAVPSAAAQGEALVPIMQRYQAGDPLGAVDGFMQLVAGPRWRDGTARAVPDGPEQAERSADTTFRSELPGVAAWHVDVAKVVHITQPVLFVWGDKTSRFQREAKDLVRTWLPQMEEYVVPDAGHPLQMVNPLAVAQGIAAFVSSQRS